MLNTEFQLVLRVGMYGVIPLLPTYLYDRHADSFTFMLVVLIKILHTILEVFNLIQNYVVYWIVIYFSLLHGGFAANNSQN